MARKKTESTTTKKPKSTKPRTKKTTKKEVKKEVVKTPEVVEEIKEEPKTPLQISMEQIEAYKSTHDGQLPDGIDLEEVKRNAEAGFSTIIITDEDNTLPEEVRATLNFVEELDKNEQ